VERVRPGPANETIHAHREFSYGFEWMVDVAIQLRYERSFNEQPRSPDRL
jgi:hypothetical protein